MKSLILALSFAVFTAGLAVAPFDAEAKRMGGGSSSGMQRSTPARTPPPATPAQAAPTSPALAGAAPAAAPKRSWMGPIAGLAAGLGIAALMGSMGLGAGMGNILTMVLLAAAAFFAIRFLMNRFASNRAPGAMATPNGMQFAGAGAGAGGTPPVTAGSSSPWTQTASNAVVLPAAAAATAATVSALPAGFDAPGFERIAKMIFIRMQAANDTADLNDLRNFTTPEMFAGVKLDLQERGSAAQTTDVVRIDAEVLEVVSEADRQIVSVRFHGLIREEKDGAATSFDEIWHLVKPADGSREWAIAGIQQQQALTA